MEGGWRGGRRYERCLWFRFAGQDPAKNPRACYVGGGDAKNVRNVDLDLDLDPERQTIKVV